MRGMARIRIIEPDEAQGELRDIYEEIGKSRGKIAEVHKIQSLNPVSIRDHMALYMTTMFAKSPLSRPEREMMAVVVSVINGCEYCRVHHGEALLHYWKDPARLAALEALGGGDRDAAGLSERERALCEYARVVTEEPASPQVEETIAALRKEGLDDRAVLDATLVAAYFNWVNRVVLALGLELEADPGGYRYD
jgi:uncharacterized peroxidase-related enzyme